MALFPQNFIEDLKHHADIVVVIGDYVSLKKSGATYKGLCPFHGEKTPSFHVNRDKGFFHCFGCGVGGDVFKFLELHDKVGFADAVKQLAQRFGLTIPELEQSDEQRASSAERETLLADLFIAIGSSLVVYPAAGFPELAKRNGSRLVILNLQETGLDGLADLVLHRPIGETLGATVGVE